MDYLFDDWKKNLDDFKASVEKELEEIRRHKAEVQQIKEEIMSELNRGRYIRDEQRIIISAPEIIIGNVDRGGMLLSSGGSYITMRSNTVRTDAAGSTGSVETRAASIRNIAVDPGIDGLEAVVGPVSEIVSQAQSIVIQGDAAEGVFPMPASGAGSGGVRIHADKRLQLEASQYSETKKNQIDNSVKALQNEKKALESSAKDLKKTVEDTFSDMQKHLDSVEELRETDDDVRSNVLDIQELNEQNRLLSPTLYNALSEYIEKLSRLAETNRQIDTLKKQKDSLAQGNDFTDKSTGASMSLCGEQITIISADGDGNYRKNDEAGIGIYANKVQVAALQQDSQLMENGQVNINAKTIALSTANTKYSSDIKNGDITADGDIIVTSKNVTVEAVDRELKDGELKEKALTKEGKLAIRIENTDLSATDTEGKATGSVSVNSKSLQVKSMDVDKDKRTDKSLTEGSSMLLLAEKMFVGAKDKDNKSKKIQAVSEEMGLFADKTLEAQQGDAKAVLQLADGNAAVSGGKTQIYGDTTVNGKTEVKDELTAPKATIDNLEAKTSFKSTNISDGIAVPAPAAAGSLSAKLKTEDAPKEE